MEVNFNSKQILRSNRVEPDEETLEQKSEEIYLPNISSNELERFASLRELFEEKMSFVSDREADRIMQSFVDYVEELNDRLDEKTLRGVLLFYLISPDDSDNVSGEEIERFDLDSESIEDKIKEILEII